MATTLNKLKKLDFAPGIRAEDVNNNFYLVHDWITSERSRVGGSGLVEGFELSADTSNFTVTIGKGSFINDKGEEYVVGEETIEVGEPAYVSCKEEIICPENGIITLSRRPYDYVKHGHIEYIPGSTIKKPDVSIFSIRCEETGEKVPFAQVSGSVILINNANYWSGRTLIFNYYATESRIDSILLNMDGTYSYQKSIESTSPAHVDLGDYENSYMIGAVYWTVDLEVNVEFFTNHRSYRKIYVNEDNVLYVDGKPYKQSQVIYFIRPESPVLNDLWYNEEDNTLYVWKFKNGEYGWTAINDFSTIHIRDYKVWNKRNFPNDYQTFRFEDDEMNLEFIPGSNALEIIIDNAPLMHDQYEEIVVYPDDTLGKEYSGRGVGFKLKEPLDRSTYVEVYVNHSVKTEPLNDVFRRAGMFVSEGHIVMTDLNPNQVFKTASEYVLGEDQLEVYVNGSRLLPGVEYEEMLNSTTLATSSDKNGKDTMSSYFRINVPLKNGDIIAHKVLKHVWNYDQVSLLIQEILRDIKDAKAQATALRHDLSVTNAVFSNKFNDVAAEIDVIKTTMPATENFIKKNEKISYSNLDTAIKNKLVGQQISTLMSTMEVEPIPNFTKKDFVQVFLVTKNQNRILIPNIDYELTEISGRGLMINLTEEIPMSSQANIYVNGFKIGVEG